MPQIAPDPNPSLNHSPSEQTPADATARKPWVKPSASVEQVREVTARNPGGSRLDGGGSGSCLS
jgi:hypothetical protein